MNYEKTFTMKVTLKCESNDPLGYVTPELMASGVREKLDNTWMSQGGSLRTKVTDVCVWPGFKEQLLHKLDQLTATLAELKKATEGMDG